MGPAADAAACMGRIRGSLDGRAAMQGGQDLSIVATSIPSDEDPGYVIQVYAEKAP